jgi:Virulence factor
VARYRILAWGDIPTQVQATDGAGSRVNRQLPDRFMQEIDRIAMRDGLTGTDAYTLRFAWSAYQERAGTADEVADAVTAELLASWDRRA